MRKICFVTGSRADYSSLYPVMKLALNSKKLKFQLIATCMHLSPKFGNTYKEIQNDGFKIDAKIKVQIWDTAGQERFASMMSTYYRRSHGVVLVHDVSQPSTFLAMEKWRLKLQDHVDSEDCKMIILANKIDLLDTDYDMQKTNKYASEHGAIGTFATSAMTNCNIEVAFQNLVTAIAKKEKKKKTKENPTMDQEKQQSDLSDPSDSSDPSDPSDPSDMQPRSGVVLTLINSKTYRSAKNRRSRGCC